MHFEDGVRTIGEGMLWSKPLSPMSFGGGCQKKNQGNMYSPGTIWLDSLLQ